MSTPGKSLNAKCSVIFHLVIPARTLVECVCKSDRAHSETVLVESASEIQKLAALRDLLLPKLMSGEIRVGDADKIVKEFT